MNIANIAFVVPVVLVILASCILLQIFLSKRDNKWLGLMLPIIFFCVALAGSGYQIYECSTTTYENTNAGAFGWVGAAAAFFFTYNVPTVIMLAIYFSCRGKTKA